jgi:hypothetical protein
MAFKTRVKTRDYQGTVVQKKVTSSVSVVMVPFLLAPPQPYPV